MQCLHVFRLLLLCTPTETLCSPTDSALLSHYGAHVLDCLLQELNRNEREALYVQLASLRGAQNYVTGGAGMRFWTEQPNAVLMTDRQKLKRLTDAWSGVSVPASLLTG